MIKTLMTLILLLTLSFLSNVRGQEQSILKTFKVHIGANALMCPNLGPKLRTNAEQIGAKVILFDTKDDVMLLDIPEEKKKIANIAYITKLVQLTGYPDELITVTEIKEEEKKGLLKLKE